MSSFIVGYMSESASSLRSVVIAFAGGGHGERARDSESDTEESGGGDVALESNDTVRNASDGVVEPDVEPLVVVVFAFFFFFFTDGDVFDLDGVVEPDVEPLVDPLFDPAFEPAFELAFDPGFDPAFEPTFDPAFDEPAFVFFFTARFALPASAVAAFFDDGGFAFFFVVFAPFFLLPGFFEGAFFLPVEGFFLPVDGAFFFFLGGGIVSSPFLFVVSKSGGALC
jgi:hypothetical protein